MPRRTYFSDLWLKLPQYKDWLRKKDDITGQCSYCAEDIYVSNKSHAGNKKHQSRSPTEPNNFPCHFLIEVKMRRIKR